jgi:hypothetical protein
MRLDRMILETYMRRDLVLVPAEQALEVQDGEQVLDERLGAQANRSGR